MKIIYQCEKCERNDFKTENECREHEMQHGLEEKLKMLPKGSKICPKCSGKGWKREGGREETFQCNVCKGEKFVIPKTDY